MEMDSPKFLRELCAKESIRPFSHFVERSPWKLRKSNFKETFDGKMGIYCCWWSGPQKKFLDLIAQRENCGEGHPRKVGLSLEHDLIPAYVGRTANAAKRIHQRLIEFPRSMKRWLTTEQRLIKPLNGFCGNFNLFNYPDRARDRIASMVNDPSISLAQAQVYLIENPSQCHELIGEFQQDYYSLMYDNYSISFVPFSDEWDSFFAEALCIGLLRPPLNLS